MPPPKDFQKKEEWKRQIGRANLGRLSPKKGKTLEEYFSPEKARSARQGLEKATRIAAERSTGKTAIERYGKEKASELASNLSRLYKGKSFEEIMGVEKAKIRRENQRNAHLGKPAGAWSDEEKTLLSNTAIRNILSGKSNPQLNYRAQKQIKLQVKAGIICCQSSWEVSYAQHLDQNPEVLKFEKDKIRIPYIYEGKQRIYIVDFLVTYVDGRQELVEIKPSALVDKDENPTKFKAAEDWCFSKRMSSDLRIKFVIVTENELNILPKQPIQRMAINA